MSLSFFLYHYNTISVFVIVIIITYYLDAHGNTTWTTGFGCLKLGISGSDIAYLPGVFQPLYPFQYCPIVIDQSQL